MPVCSPLPQRTSRRVRRGGLSLLEVSLAVALLAIAATAAVPMIATSVDQLARDARGLRAACSHARTLAIVHNAEVTVAVTPDGYALTASTAAAAASLEEAMPGGGPHVVDLARSGQTQSQPTELTATGTLSTVPIPSWTFLPTGGLAGRVDPVLATLRTAGREQVVRIDFRTGLAELHGEPTATGGGSGGGSGSGSGSGTGGGP